MIMSPHSLKLVGWGILNVPDKVVIIFSPCSKQLELTSQ